MDIRYVWANIKSEVGGIHNNDIEMLRGEVRQERLLHGSVRPGNTIFLAMWSWTTDGYNFNPTSLHVSHLNKDG